jgi:hypothetical protein
MTLGEWNEYGRLVIADMEENQKFREEVRGSLRTLTTSLGTHIAEEDARRGVGKYIANLGVPAFVAVVAAFITAWFTK